MDNDDILKKCDYVCEQPLTTEEGFINPAAINELTAAINNIPPTHERLAGDPEWSEKRWTHWRHIVGALAYWAIRNISDDYSEKNNDGDWVNVFAHDSPIYPPGLEKIIGYVGTCLRKKSDTEDVMGKFGFIELSLCDINRMLHDFLMDQDMSIFDGWNTEEIMGKHWLDLDALLHNVCLTIRDERRDDARFEAEFRKEHGSLPGEEDR